MTRLVGWLMFVAGACCVYYLVVYVPGEQIFLGAMAGLIAGAGFSAAIGIYDR